MHAYSLLIFRLRRFFLYVLAQAARSVTLPPGSLPNGSGLEFGPPGTPQAGANLRAASVIWEWTGVDRRAVVWPAALLGGSVVGLALHLVLFALGAAVLRAVGELGTAFPAAPSLVAMTSVVVRAFTMLLAGSLVATASGSSSAIHAQDSWTEARFRTGCEPGPFHEPPPPEHLETGFPPLGTEPNSALVRADLGELSPAAPRPLGRSQNFSASFPRPARSRAH